MATWVTHFRIAEELLKEGYPVSKVDFLVGNIGPDCGLRGEDGKFTPSKEITHFEIDGIINSDSFYQQYLSNEMDGSSHEFSYLIGYYIHLVTDEEWIKLIEQKKKEKVYQEILNTPGFNKLVKEDWYGLDLLYLKNHKDSIFWTHFQNINDFPEYLSFFWEGQTLEQIRNITDFYQSNMISDDHEFIYLKSYEVDEFVKNVLQKVKKILNQRIPIQPI